MALPTRVPASTLLSAQSDPSAAQELTYKERQGLAMAWVFGALGMFLLLAILALGAAVVFNVGFVGWLIGTAVMGHMIVAVVAAVHIFVLKPRR